MWPTLVLISQPEIVVVLVVGDYGQDENISNGNLFLPLQNAIAASHHFGFVA